MHTSMLIPNLLVDWERMLVRPEQVDGVLVTALPHTTKSEHKGTSRSESTLNLGRRRRCCWPE